MRTSEHGRTPHLGRNTENTSRGRYIGVGLVLAGVLWAVITTPAAAQTPTVTSYPAAVATATANDARALLAAQQIAAASEALGRSEGAIAAGQNHIGELTGIADSLKATIDQQAAQITTMTSELQQVRADKQTILTAYSATQAKAAEMESRFYVNPAVAILAAGFLLAVVVVFVMWKWNRQPAAQPIITRSYTLADESIEDEKDFIP